MMKLLGVVLAISVAMGSEIPLKIIYDVVPGFPKVDVCDRMCTSEYWMAPGNVRTVQFTGTLQDSEDAQTVCNCMYKYIGQMGSNWLDGVAAKCYKQCNNLTLRLTGQPDPTYDATAVDESFDRPLEKLGEIFSQLDEGKIKVAELACQSNTYVDDCGWIHCTLECPLSSDESRTKETICDDILVYFNQHSWLEDAKSFCNQRDDTMEVEFVGNSRPGDTCVSPNYFTY